MYMYDFTVCIYIYIYLQAIIDIQTNISIYIYFIYTQFIYTYIYTYLAVGFKDRIFHFFMHFPLAKAYGRSTFATQCRLETWISQQRLGLSRSNREGFWSECPGGFDQHIIWSWWVVVGFTMVYVTWKNGNQENSKEIPLFQSIIFFRVLYTLRGKGLKKLQTSTRWAPSR